MQLSHTESKGWNVSNAMDLTNLRTTMNSGGTARQTINWTHCILKQRRANCVSTLSNAPTVRKTTKPIQINTHSGGTASTENGISRNTPKSITTGSNQSALWRATKRKYDFEKPQSPFPKYAEKPSHCQHHPWDLDILWCYPNLRTAMVYHSQSSQHFKQCKRRLCRNWTLFTINPLNKASSLRVTVYINICLTYLYFFLWTDIINHLDILLLSFTSNCFQYFVLNIYSDFVHSALKYLKDIEINIDNVLIIISDFNIRDSLWNSSFPHHSSISDDLLLIANSFQLALLMPTNPCPTKYSNTVGEANLTIDLMFLRCDSIESNQHSIHSDWWLISDHAPLFITIPIANKLIPTSKLSI